MITPLSAANKKPLRVGICGSGITINHIAGYQKIAGIEVTAIAGPDVERCRAVASQYNIAQVFPDYHEMLALGLDAISIGVPNAYHAPMALDAFAAGCHVLCEKPLATSAADGARMVEAAHTAGKVLMVAFNRRYRPNAIALKNLIAEGTLGPIYHAKAGWTRRSGIPGFGGWFTTKALSGGGPLIDLGVHVLDLALYMMDYPQPVAVSGATYAEFGPRGKGTWGYGTRPDDPARAVFDVEDFATGFVRFGNGATLTLEASWAGYQAMADDVYVQLYGRNGGARLLAPTRIDEPTLQVVAEMGGLTAQITPDLPQEPGITEYDREVAAFIAAVRSGTQAPAPGEHGVTIMRIIDALYRSAQMGQQVDL